MVRDGPLTVAMVTVLSTLCRNRWTLADQRTIHRNTAKPGFYTNNTILS